MSCGTPCREFPHRHSLHKPSLPTLNTRPENPNDQFLAVHRGCGEAILTCLFIELKNILSPFEQIRGSLAGSVVNPSGRVSEGDILPGPIHRRSTQSVRYIFCVSQI